MVSDKWTLTETVYFMTTSLLTIGYGDVVVNNHGIDRLLDTFLIVLGLVAITIWASCASRALDAYRSRRAGGSRLPDFDADAAVRQCCWMLAHRLVFLAVVILIGVVVFMLGEDTGFIPSFYWSIVTASSIGYGDVVPSTTAMRWFTSFYSVVATGAMLETLRFAGAFPFEVWTLRAEGRVLDQFTKAGSPSERAAAATLVDTAVKELLGTSPQAGDAVGRSDVALSMLLLLNRISQDDIQQAARIFDKLGAWRDPAAFPVQTADEPKRR